MEEARRNTSLPAYTVWRAGATGPPGSPGSPGLRIAAIDPGVKNLAIYAGDFTATPPRTLLSVTLDASNLQALVGALDEHVLPVLSTCSTVLVERQMSINYKQVRISQHILTYMLLRLPVGIGIYELPSVWKRRAFLPGVGVKLSRTVIKRCSVEAARAGADSAAFDGARGKKVDDIADAICYTLAWRQSVISVAK